MGGHISEEMKKKTTEVENLNDLCRPSVLAEQYRQLVFIQAPTLKSSLRIPERMKKETWSYLLNMFFSSLYTVSEFVLADIDHYGKLVTTKMITMILIKIL